MSTCWSTAWRHRNLVLRMRYTTASCPGCLQWGTMRQCKQLQEQPPDACSECSSQDALQIAGTCQLVHSCRGPSPG